MIFGVLVLNLCFFFLLSSVFGVVALLDFSGEVAPPSGDLRFYLISVPIILWCLCLINQSSGKRNWIYLVGMIVVAEGFFLVLVNCWWNVEMLSCKC